MNPELEKLYTTLKTSFPDYIGDTTKDDFVSRLSNRGEFIKWVDTVEDYLPGYFDGVNKQDVINRFHPAAKVLETQASIRDSKINEYQRQEESKPIEAQPIYGGSASRSDFSDFDFFKAFKKQQEQKPQVNWEINEQAAREALAQNPPDLTQVTPQELYDFAHPGASKVQQDNADLLTTGAKRRLDTDGKMTIWGANRKVEARLTPQEILQAQPGQIPGVGDERLLSLKQVFSDDDRIRQKDELKQLTFYSGVLQDQLELIPQEYYEANKVLQDAVAKQDQGALDKDTYDSAIKAQDYLKSIPKEVDNHFRTTIQKAGELNDRINKFSQAYPDVVLTDALNKQIQADKDKKFAGRNKLGLGLLSVITSGGVVPGDLIANLGEAVVEAPGRLIENVASTLDSLQPTNKVSAEAEIRRSVDLKRDGTLRDATVQTRAFSERLADFSHNGKPYQVAFNSKDQPIEIYDENGNVANIPDKDKLLAAADTKGLAVKARTKYNKSAIYNAIGDTTSDLLGTMALTAMTDGMGAGPWISRAREMGSVLLQYSGQFAEEALQNGATVEQAAAIGLAKGSLEGLTEAIFPFAAKITGKARFSALKDNLERIIRMEDPIAVKRLAMKQLRGAMLGIPIEGLEEDIADIGHPILNRAFNNYLGTNLNDDPPATRQLVEDFGLGAAVSVLPGLIGGVKNARQVSTNEFLVQSLRSVVDDIEGVNRVIGDLNLPNTRDFQAALQNTAQQAKPYLEQKDLSENKKNLIVAGIFDSEYAKISRARLQSTPYEEEAKAKEERMNKALDRIIETIDAEELDSEGFGMGRMFDINPNSVSDEEWAQWQRKDAGELGAKHILNRRRFIEDKIARGEELSDREEFIKETLDAAYGKYGEEAIVDNKLQLGTNSTKLGENVNPLQDVESTAKAIEEARNEYGLIPKELLSFLPKPYEGDLSAILSEKYHAAKADGSNPELVKAVEDLLGPPAESQTIVTNEDFKNYQNQNPDGIDQKKIGDDLMGQFKDGDKIIFFAEKERTGTWNGQKKAIIDENGNQWGTTAILSDPDGYIRKNIQANDTENKIGVQSSESQGENTQQEKPIQESGSQEIKTDRVVQTPQEEEVDPEIAAIQQKLAEDIAETKTRTPFNLQYRIEKLQLEAATAIREIQARKGSNPKAVAEKIIFKLDELATQAQGDKRVIPKKAAVDVVDFAREINHPEVQKLVQQYDKEVKKNKGRAFNNLVNGLRFVADILKSPLSAEDKTAVNNVIQDQIKQRNENRAKPISRGKKLTGPTSTEIFTEIYEVLRSVPNTRPASEGSPEKVYSRAEQNARELQALRAYAEANGLMQIPLNQRFGRAKDAGEFESLVYFNGETVVKAKANTLYDNWHDFIESIEAQGALFPEAVYTLEGFTIENGEFRAVISQPNLVSGPADVTFEQIKEDLEKMGFVMVKGLVGEMPLFIKDDLSITDVRPGNVTLRDGILYYIDPVIQSAEGPIRVGVGEFRDFFPADITDDETTLDPYPDLTREERERIPEPVQGLRDTLRSPRITFDDILDNIENFAKRLGDPELIEAINKYKNKEIPAKEVEDKAYEVAYTKQYERAEIPKESIKVDEGQTEETGGEEPPPPEVPPTVDPQTAEDAWFKALQEFTPLVSDETIVQEVLWSHMRIFENPYEQADYERKEVAVKKTKGLMYGIIDQIKIDLGDIEAIKLFVRALKSPDITQQTKRFLARSIIEHANFAPDVMNNFRIYDKELATVSAVMQNAGRLFEDSNDIDMSEQAAIIKSILGIGDTFDRIEQFIEQADNSNLVPEEVQKMEEEKTVEALNSEIAALKKELKEALEEQKERKVRVNKNKAVSRKSLLEARLQQEYGNDFLAKIKAKIDEVAAKCK